MTDNHIGKRIYVATALPASNDQAGFEALNWVLVKGPQTLPQLGVSHSIGDIPDLASGFTAGNKGAAKGVDTTGTHRDVDGDTGQANLKAQCLDKVGALSVKIVKGSGTDGDDGPEPVSGDPVEYAAGIAHSYQPNQATDTSHEGFQYGFRQNAPTVEATEPA
ncbi:MAG: hypothetical protein JXR13_18740 [Thalassovita sp.]